jgi:hypothetical protein
MEEKGFQKTLNERVRPIEGYRSLKTLINLSRAYLAGCARYPLSPASAFGRGDPRLHRASGFRKTCHPSIIVSRGRVVGATQGPYNHVAQKKPDVTFVQL